ncbi:MAG: YbfB/YjiJ family MFS transporter [Alphaproteobacteria bacterium]
MAACPIEAAGVALSVLVITPAAILLSAVLLGGTFVGITAMVLVTFRL